MKNHINYIIVLSFLFASCTATKKVAIPKLPQVTGNAKELTRITFDDIPEFRPKLSSDGQSLLYDVRDDSKYGSDRWSVRVKNVNKPGFTPLTSNGCITPAWHPDGKNYVFSYLRPSPPVIARSSINQSGITYISQSGLGEWDYAPSVSHDGKKILLHTDIQSVTHIGSVDSDGSNFTILAEGESGCWHPSGKQIAFVKSSAGKNHIFIMSLDKNQVTQITSGNYNYDTPAFSTDGSKLVYVSDKDGDNYHIYTMNIDGTEVTQLTQGKSKEYYPFWSSDNSIYFCSNAGSPKRASSNWSYSDIWRVKPFNNEEGFLDSEN